MTETEFQLLFRSDPRHLMETGALSRFASIEDADAAASQLLEFD